MTLHYKFLKVWTHSAMIYVQKYRGLQLVMPCTVCKSWWCAFISTKPGKLPPRLSLDSSSLEGDISSKVPPALAFLLQPGPNQLIHLHPCLRLFHLELFVVGLVGEQLQVLSLNQTNSLLIAQLHLEVMAHLKCICTPIGTLYLFFGLYFHLTSRVVFS